MWSGYDLSRSGYDWLGRSKHHLGISEENEIDEIELRLDYFGRQYSWSGWYRFLPLSSLIAAFHSLLSKTMRFTEGLFASNT